MHEAYLPVEDTIRWAGLSKNWSIFWRLSSESTTIIPLAYGMDGLGKMYACDGTEVCSCIKSLNDDGNKFLSKFSINIKWELGHCPPRSLSSSQSLLYLLFAAAVHKEEVKKSWKFCIITSDWSFRANLLLSQQQYSWHYSFPMETRKQICLRVMHPNSNLWTLYSENLPQRMKS